MLRIPLPAGIHPLRDALPRPAGRHALALLALAGLMAVAGIAEWREAAGGTQQLFSHEMVGYGNLLLLLSTLGYIVHLRCDSEWVGRGATLLAALGAAASILAVSTRWIETYLMHRPGHVPASASFEIMSLFSVATVVIYLAMERVYRTRAAGAFVMTIVSGAIVFQIWLEANELGYGSPAVPALRAYWMHAHVLANFIGYGAFAVAAGAAALHLFRLHGGPVREAGRLGALTDRAILVGFPFFTVATVLGTLWAHEAWGRYWAWDPKEIGALAVWAIYAGYVLALRRGDARRRAWWAIAGFAAAAFCFLGLSLLWPGLHVYGPRL